MVLAGVQDGYEDRYLSDGIEPFTLCLQVLVIEGQDDRQR